MFVLSLPFHVVFLFFHLFAVFECVRCTFLLCFAALFFGFHTIYVENRANKYIVLLQNRNSQLVWIKFFFGIQHTTQYTHSYTEKFFAQGPFHLARVHFSKTYTLLLYCIFVDFRTKRTDRETEENAIDKSAWLCLLISPHFLLHSGSYISFSSCQGKLHTCFMYIYIRHQCARDV